MTLKETRKLHKLNQENLPNILEYPFVRIKDTKTTSQNSPIKYEYIKAKLAELTVIDETHGVLTIESIKEVCARVFQKYEVRYCYLFGSYAKDKATPTSDVDLLISTSLTGLKFFGLIEDLRVELKKKVDVLNQEQIRDNYELTNEILCDGVKIYG